MDSKWQFHLVRITRQTWFRSTLFCVLGAIAALVSIFLGPFVPDAYAERIGADSVDSILAILASSMLAVATFSLATMVSAYTAASNSTTPRAATLLIEDTTSHNALGTFIGAFLYSVVGIVLLHTGIYGGGGRLVLFLATIAVIVLVVATLLGWIDVLTRLGRVGQTIDKVEEVSHAALQIWAKVPEQGCQRLLAIPHAAEPVFTDKVAYVQHVDAGRLQELAEAHDLGIYNPALAGKFLDPGKPLCHVTGSLDEAVAKQLRSAFTLGDARTFEQDSRFGLIALSEIASRAMSPAINDPGTAIVVIGTLVRLLVRFERARNNSVGSPTHDRVWVAPLLVSDMVTDAFRPVARDAAGHVEVCIRLQKGLATLAALGEGELAEASRNMADEALLRSQHALTIDADLKHVTDAHYGKGETARA